MYVKKGLVLFSPSKSSKFGQSRNLYFTGKRAKYIKNSYNRALRQKDPKSKSVRTKRKKRSHYNERLYQTSFFNSPTLVV